MNTEKLNEVLDKQYVSQSDLVSVLKYLIDYISDMEKEVKEVKELVLALKEVKKL